MAMDEETRELHDRSLDALRELRLSEVWCANDDQPSVIERVMRNPATGRVERKALCLDCNWLALAASRVQPRRVEAVR